MTKYEGDYECGWCGTEFTAFFGKGENIKGEVSGRGTSPVLCPNCNVRIKPIIDAKKIKEVKEV